ncbi:MAG TPA: mechanosensitive ion channel domain-containing protein [Acidobacteriota bacterium]|nr:mechanosensitive ion channel domain-containing protein [Acidobacteriota bacterium]
MAIDMDQVWIYVINYSYLLVTALIILFVGWVVSKWAYSLTSRSLGKRSVDEALKRFISQLVKYAVLAAAAIAALSQIGIQMAGFLALLGAAGLAVGLALQGSLSNFAAGVMILLFRPFTIGDKVTGGGHTGKVEEIGLFATVMITPDNEKIIIPNSRVTGDSIVNHTTLGTLRGDVSIGVAYGTDLTQALQVLQGAAERCQLVLEDPAPKVVFSGFGASSLDINVKVWATSADLYNMLHQVKVNVYDDLNAAGIDIPFDQIVVHQAGE